MLHKFLTLEIKKCSVAHGVFVAVIAITSFIFCVPILVEITKWWFDIVQGWF